MRLYLEKQKSIFWWLFLLSAAYLGLLYYIFPSSGAAKFALLLNVPLLLLLFGAAFFLLRRVAGLASTQINISRNAIRGSDTGMAAIDNDGTIREANPKFHEILGYAERELAGGALSSLIREKDRGALLANIKSSLLNTSPGADGPAFRVEGIKKSWSRVILEIRIHRLESGAEGGLMVMARDVTREVTMEAELSRLKGALEQAEEAFIIADAEGIVEYANTAAKRLNGLSESLKGLKLKGNWAAGDNEKENRGMWDAVRIGRSWKSEVAGVGAGGARHIEEVSVYPVRDGEGEIASFLAIRQDVTSRKRSEKLISNLTRAIEHSADMIMVTDPEGIVEYVNPAVVQTLGFSREELIGGKPNLFKSGAHGEEFYRAMWGRIKSGQPWTGRITNKKKNGEFVEEELGVSPVFDEKGAVVNFVAVARDITAKIEQEKELLARKEEAESASRFKDELISIVSHDLKNPIIAALGLTRLALNDDTRKMDPFHAGLLQRVMASGEQAMGMIDKLLLMSPSRLGRWRLEKKFLNLFALVDLALDDLGHLASAKGIRLENRLPKNFRIHADYDLFTEVVTNLISNAIKFTHRGGEVSVSAPDGGDNGFCARDNGVCVRDNGVGIPANVLPNLFRKETARSTLGTAGEKGYGMGLPFCHEVIKKHGGSIQAESKVGEGTVFTITLPAARPTVLLVDDDEDFRLLMKELLMGMGVETMEAFNGAQALDMIDSRAPSLLITDLYMQPMDGFELLKELRRKNCSMAKIAVTSDTQIDTRQRAFASGAQDFVNKPIVAYDFIPRVRRLLEIEKA